MKHLKNKQERVVTMVLHGVTVVLHGVTMVLHGVTMVLHVTIIMLQGIIKAPTELLL